MSKKEKKDFKDTLKDLGKEMFGSEINISENVNNKSNMNNSEMYLNQIPKVSKDRKAFAPYNFIPLNNYSIKSDFEITKTGNDIYHLGKNTGYVNIKLSNFTPMYLRDNKGDNDSENFINPDFFAPANGKLRIPGSSVRGLLRNLIEIVSYGKFSSYEDKRLYVRGMADRSSLRNDYQETMIDLNDNFFPKVKSGWIKKEGYKNYVIYPSIKDSFGNIFYRVNFDNKTGNVDNSGSPPINLKIYEFKEVYFNPINAIEHIHYRNQKIKGVIKRVTYKLKYALVNGISLISTSTYKTKGFIINSGLMNNKHMHWIINEPDFYSGKNINYNVIKDYIGDENRDSINIIKELYKNQKGLPCFYIEDDHKNVSGFGFTAMFRLPYSKTIGEHIPEFLKNKDRIDIAEAIFGNETNFAGRINVEDLFCESKYNPEILLGENYPQNLSGPKPTTFQHYLTQLSEDVRDLKHYNPDLTGKLSAIRGNKLYWHKENENWIADDKDVKKFPKQFTAKINPVRKDTIFKGRIKFENLSDIELGALLFALDLPEGCLHKIGMGKPLGLGSVKIEPTLHLSNRKERYKELFSEWSDEIPKSYNIELFKDKFACYVLSKLKGEKKDYKSEDLWKEDRMKELKIMIDWKNKPDNSRTRYMDLDEFIKRPVLPRPSDV